MAFRNYTQLRTRHDNPVDRIEAWFTNNLQLSGPLRKLVKIMLDYTGSHMHFPGIDATIQGVLRIRMQNPGGEH